MILFVFAIFALHAGWGLPDVNETHYLAKAKRHWNPDWAAGDFFLNSADSHAVFYMTLGWLTRLLSLEAFAWIGRLLTWGLLAAAFTRLCLALRITGWHVLLAAGLFVALNSRYRLAGEWIVGGFEAKGLAYAAILWSLERWIRGRWNQALVWAGVATAFHALVGGWSAVALGFAWLMQGKSRPSLRAMWPGLVVSGIIAAAGIVPSLALSWDADAQTVSLANRIYVFYRLPHHLVPWQFGGQAVRRGILLLAAWWVLVWRVPADQELQRLRSFVNGAMMIAIVGLVGGLLTRQDGTLSAAVLRYYWFRLADVAVPLGIALYAVRLLQSLSMPRRDATVQPAARRSAVEQAEPAVTTGGAPTVGAAGRHLLGAALAVFAAASLASDVVQHAQATRPPADNPQRIADYPAWRDVCRWVAEHTESDALFITPRLAQTFTWYAGRGEVVNAKDIPQDAYGIVAWWVRLADVHRQPLADGQFAWRRSLTEAPPEEVERIAHRYRADYLLTDAEPRLALDLVYSNNAYAVYRLPR